MAYDKTKDPFKKTTGGRDQFGDIARDVSPVSFSPTEDIEIDPYANAVVCGSSGDLVIVPVQNADADSITFTGVSVGFIPPFRVRIVKSTTTCTCYTIETAQTE